MMQESLTEKLSAHLMRPIDEATRQRARLHLLDWLGCVAGARQSDLAELQKKYDQDKGASSIAWLGNILEMDDIHRTSILHPGPVIWSTLIAGKDHRMEEILDSAVRGYETMICIGSTFDDRHYAFYHNTVTAGVFGAAAAIACLLTDDEDKVMSAMGLAGSVAGGLWQMRNETGNAKQWHIAHALATGRNAGHYAYQGVKGPRFILEGPQGLYAATCDNPKPMLFLDQWRIHEVSFKPWGACRHIHPAIDAALELKEKVGSLDGDILVETYGDAILFCDRPNPETTNDAKFSIQHALAIVAQKGVPELADFELDALAKFADSRKHVILKQADDITARYPEHYCARVSCGGESVTLLDTLGDPERPLSKDGIINKAKTLIAWGGLADKEADRAVDLALNGDGSQAIHKMLEDWLS